MTADETPIGMPPFVAATLLSPPAPPSEPGVARKGDWMQTFTGRQFWPIDPRAEEVEIEDIAHALSHLCRFAGHVRRFYSVAEHCVRVSLLGLSAEQTAVARAHDAMEIKLALGGLLHDATEAYVVDVPRPLKRFLPGYAEIEARVARAVEERFGLETGILEHVQIKVWDETLLATEARDLMGGESAGKWFLRARPLPEVIVPWTPERARAAFLVRFAELGGRQ